jgi:hypothetical protein
MWKLLIAAVLAAQVAPSAAHAQTANLGPGTQQGETRVGAFGGARLRIALGGGQRVRVRAGVALAPALHRTENGASRLRIGEGLEYGIADRRAPAVSIAGYRASDVKDLAGGARNNVSTTGWIAIGAGVIVLVGVGVLGWLVHEGNKNTE